jgi:probable phosphomutase (TIGR03848 family)
MNKGVVVSTYIFLRHGHSAANKEGLLTGQLPGVGLSPHGVEQAAQLVDRIGKGVVDFVHISPIERCQLTIDPWLNSKNSQTISSLEIDDGFSEINFGEWSGKKLSTLRRNPLWKSVQENPSQVTFPGGESFKKAQKRAVQSFDLIRGRRGEKVHLIVSHSDTIKLVVSHLLGMKLDQFQSLEISPASFTIFRGDKKRISLITMNNSGSLKEILG